MDAAHSASMSEPEFAEFVNTISSDPARHKELTDLLSEENPLYLDRGSAAIVRMRGWVLLALGRIGLSESSLIYVLEELDTGMDPYLVAAAATALRTQQPSAMFAPFVLRAITNIRYRDEPVSFEAYGGYSDDAPSTTPIQELLLTLAWLGPEARGALAEIEALQSPSQGLPRKLRPEIERIASALRGIDPVQPECCALSERLRTLFTWNNRGRRDAAPLDEVTFDDHDGRTVAFGEYFKGQPTIVVFFYTRCDNPQKCSLTITKLARIQKSLEEMGLADSIRTAAITYDPEYDDADRIRGYGVNRGARLGDKHRMLRTTGGLDALREHFRLGVNFVGSIVNRHRLEVFILDEEGRIAAVFERLQWNENDVVARAKECLRENKAGSRPSPAAPIAGTLASVGIAIFPKCPICWSAYLSVFGIAGLESIPYPPWLIVLLAAILVVNLANAILRAHATRRYWPVVLIAAGASLILGFKVGLGWDHAALPGVLMTLVGSLGAALGRRQSPLTT